MEERSSLLIRHITQHDDFVHLHQMMNDTAKRFNPDPTFHGFGTTPEELKDDYSDITRSNGFLAEQNGMVIGFIGVSLSPITKNGNITFGYLEGYEFALSELVDKCPPVVRDNGGNKLYKFAFSKFGQIRNSEITLWERMGFTSEEYSNVTIILHLKDWIEPQDFNNANITPASDTELETIKQLLIEDDESFIAERIDNPKKVLLTLRDENTNEIMGLAYYFVDLVNKGTEYEFLDAYAFTLHFRPNFELSKTEMQRLLHAAIFSTKQLGVLHIITRITLKNFTIFALMIREGFDDPEMEKNSTVNLYKKV
ncbi:hypothetical protein Back11_32860 [Paenibacillus baekrokdamisoli]|uniref:Uncharacterized protein n=1 Tax=Paenibacillus baekrokdamisoli TaxID=1712516 RepID=A0A3G9J7X6_9BACL|nr:hypothetical protein [Paenibacillus baekrokdamisoli]MBB3071547.1 hypothetical protein [Paenibacillus baekrokdamisoli]BBH21941.1 hypothetical protein Back11_32860 [Paenibacillus baekrokdamisoli]